eukprot:240613-Chlamydomonas_euryale.AAC.1
MAIVVGFLCGKCGGCEGMATDGGCLGHLFTVLRGSTTAAQYQSPVVRVGTVGSRLFGGASPVKLYSTAQH